MVLISNQMEVFSMTFLTYRTSNPFGELLGAFDYLFTDQCCEGDTTECRWTPPVDIIETEEAYTLIVEVPGLTKDEIAIEAEGATLTITGTKKDCTATECKLHRSERRFGDFKRAFQLPEKAETEAIKAVCKEGILELTIPKKKEAQPKKVEIVTE